MYNHLPQSIAIRNKGTNVTNRGKNILNNWNACLSNKYGTKENRNNTLSPLIRQLLLIAASDGVELVELETIHKFGQKFGISRMDIILMLASMGLKKS